MDTSKELKKSKYFCCESCDYLTSKKCNFERHIITEKHKKIQLELSGIEFLEQRSKRSLKKNLNVFVVIFINLVKVYQSIRKNVVIRLIKILSTKMKGI